MVQTVSTNNLYSTTINGALNVQAQWAVAETQQASGLQAQDFGSLGGSSSRELLNFETDIAQAKNFAGQAATVASTTQAMYTAVGTVNSAVSKLQVLISQSMSSPDNSALISEATGIQQTMLSQINQQVGGNFLFAGSNTAQAPADMSHYPTMAINTSTTPNSFSYNSQAADTSYYTGDNTVLSVQVNLQQTVTYGVTANNPAFEEALRAAQAVIEASQVSAVSTATPAPNSPNAAAGVATGALSVSVGGVTSTFNINATDTLASIAQTINKQTVTSGVTANVVPDTNGGFHLRLTSGQIPMTINSDGSGLFTTTPQTINKPSASQITSGLQQALTISNKATTDLGNLQQAVSNVSNQLSDAKTEQTNFVTFLENSLSSVKDVDAAQAASLVQHYQTNLQASYLAVASLTKLSLAQYL